MAHEKSITIQKRDGSWANISSMVKGRSAPRKAESLFRAGSRKALGGKTYKTVGGAVKAAKARSKKFDR